MIYMLYHLPDSASVNLGCEGRCSAQTARHVWVLGGVFFCLFSEPQAGNLFQATIVTVYISNY